MRLSLNQEILGKKGTKDNFQERELIFSFFYELAICACKSGLLVSTERINLDLSNVCNSKLVRVENVGNLQAKKWLVFFFSVLFPVNFSLIKVIVSRL